MFNKISQQMITLKNNACTRITLITYFTRIMIFFSILCQNITNVRNKKFIGIRKIFETRKEAKLSATTNARVSACGQCE